MERALQKLALGDSTHGSMNSANLLRIWQWASVIALGCAVTAYSAVQGRKLAFWSAFPDGVLYEPATVYGMILTAPVYWVVCGVGAMIAHERRARRALARVPDPFGLTVEDGRPLSNGMPAFWLIMFVVVPFGSQLHFLNQFLQECKRACWTFGGEFRLIGKAGGIDIVPGWEPGAIVAMFGISVLLAVRFFHRILRRPAASPSALPPV